MVERPRQPLVLGQGVDRVTGVMAGSPGMVRDIRNVILSQGRVEARKGFQTRSTLEDGGGNAMENVVLPHGGFAVRTEGVGIVAGHRVVGPDPVELFRVDGEGFNPEHLTQWGTLAAGSVTPPRIHGAESFSFLFLAHDEPDVTKRLRTVYYDPGAGPSFISDLTSDLDEDATAENLKFRWVHPYGDYLVGGGYGDATVENRPELVRTSKPGQPTVFLPRHYAIVGSRNDPTLAGRPVGGPGPESGGSFLIFKEHRSFALLGGSPREFRVVDADTTYGLASSRLVVAVGGAVFGWSLEGPRVWTGPGPSEDLSLPLDLTAPAPADLVAEGEVEHGFAVWIPERRIVAFVFGQRVYALQLRDRRNPRWSYFELGRSAHSGGIMQIVEAAGTPPTAYPTISAIVAGVDYADIDVTTTGGAGGDADGDEWLETWVKQDGQSWYMADSRQVVTPGPMTIRAEQLAQGTAHEALARYRRGGQYQEGWESSNPDDWPIAPTPFTTTLDTPTLDDVAFIRRDDPSNPGSRQNGIHYWWTPAGKPDAIQLLIDGAVAAEVPLAEGDEKDVWGGLLVPETGQVHTVRQVTADAVSNESAPLSRWTGPAPPPDHGPLTSPAAKTYRSEWVWRSDDWPTSTTAPSRGYAWYTEVYDRNVTQGRGWVLRATIEWDPLVPLWYVEVNDAGISHPGGIGSTVNNTFDGVSGDTIEVRLKHLMKSDGPPEIRSDLSVTLSVVLT